MGKLSNNSKVVEHKRKQSDKDKDVVKPPSGDGSPEQLKKRGKSDARRKSTSLDKAQVNYANAEEKDQDAASPVEGTEDAKDSLAKRKADEIVRLGISWRRWSPLMLPKSDFHFD